MPKSKNKTIETPFLSQDQTKMIFSCIMALIALIGTVYLIYKWLQPKGTTTAASSQQFVMQRNTLTTTPVPIPSPNYTLPPTLPAGFETGTTQVPELTTTAIPTAELPPTTAAPAQQTMRPETDITNTAGTGTASAGPPPRIPPGCTII